MKTDRLSWRLQLGFGIPIAMLIALSIVSYRCVVASTGAAAWLRRAASGDGVRLTQDIRNLVREIGNEEERLRDARQAVVDRDFTQIVFGCVLMDVQMPAMGGLECTTIIRHQERMTQGHLPIIAMTAHAMQGDEADCLAAGMDGYLSKPIRPQDLFDAVEHYLGLARAGDAPSGLA